MDPVQEAAKAYALALADYTAKKTACDEQCTAESAAHEARIAELGVAGAAVCDAECKLKDAAVAANPPVPDATTVVEEPKTHAHKGKK